VSHLNGIELEIASSRDSGEAIKGSESVMKKGLLKFDNQQGLKLMNAFGRKVGVPR
jgi:hypothetical protein